MIVVTVIHQVMIEDQASCQDNLNSKADRIGHYIVNVDDGCDTGTFTHSHLF
jgi:hypothetical protein